MGKAAIISHAGHGQYTVDVEIDTTYLTQIINQLDAEYARLLFTDKANAEAAESTAGSDLSTAQAAVDAAIFAYQLDPTDEKRQAIDAAAIEAIRVSEAYRIAMRELDTVNNRLDAIRKRLSALRDNDQTRKRDILWCTDLADGKKDRRLFNPGDQVGVIELSGQDDIGQVLQASYAPEAWKYDAARDGFLENINGLTPFEFLYNWTLLPPWQAWKHPYRSGIITAGNPADGWTVQLDNTRSIDSGIEVNNIQDDRILTGVHATYMSCDDWAFGLGDHVVLNVSISGPATATAIDATIIGFVDNPKKCLVDGFVYWASADGGATQEWQHIVSDSGSWQKDPTDPYSTDLTDSTSGGADPTIRCWIGKDVDDEATVLEWIPANAGIFVSGTQVATKPTDQSWTVLGAAVSPKKKYLYAIMRYSGADIYVMRKTMTPELTGAYYDVSTAPDGWEVSGPHSAGVNHYSSSTFHFNASCTRALSMWNFIHGAKRTPQATPAPGATWHPTTSLYDDFWKEKLEFTINAPDASTLAKAGISLANNGRQGYNVYTYASVDDISEYTDGVQTRTTSEAFAWSGSYQIETGFNGDTEIPVYLLANGSGNGSSSSVYAASATAEGSSSNNSGLYYSIPHFGILVPKSVDVSEWSSSIDSSGNPDRYASLSFTHTNSEFSALDTDAGLFAIDSIERDYVGSADYFPSPPTWHSNEIVRDTETGNLYSGALIDTSSTYDETTYIDDQPGHGIYFVGAPVIYGPTHLETAYKYDLTAYDDGTWSSLSPTNPYENVKGARSGSNKYMAYWQNTRTPGGVREYKAYLTGGDPFTLDELSDPVIYRAIHAV